jgi:DNA-binding NarL/FixJ family response regulator
MNELKILIVDDHPIVREGLKALFAFEKGFTITVITCQNGQEAIDLLAVDTFDIILLDISMPVMDGLTALRKIKNELMLDTPVLMLTTYNSLNIISQANDLGADGYLLKNSSSDELMEGIQKAIKNK